MEWILTAQAAAVPLAMREAGAAQVRTLAPGVVLCKGVRRPARPVFLRHICPAEARAELTGGMEDIGRLADALSGMDAAALCGRTFSVQSRILDGVRTAYKRFDVNTALSGRILEQGGVLDVKEPEVAVSVVIAQGEAFLGISPVRENISDWAGGARRFKQEAGQISRAEFKLLEALEIFGIDLRGGACALDLGAAPGGWTRVLRQRGLTVTAVDPAEMDPRLAGDGRITHYRGTAQAFLRAHPQARFDVVVNDMKMDSAASAALMVEAAACVRPGGAGVLTLKLPEDVGTWARRVREAEAALAEAYAVCWTHQLFHNRSEVTVHLRRR